MDMYTNNNFVLSPRTPGSATGTWHLLSPDAEIRNSPDLRLATPHAWLVARILVDGPSDLSAVHAIQDRLVAGASCSAISKRCDPYLQLAGLFRCCGAAAEQRPTPVQERVGRLHEGARCRHWARFRAPDIRPRPLRRSTPA